MPTKYEITEHKLKLYRELYNPYSDSTTYYDSYAFKEFESRSLSKFLNSVNWTTISAELTTLAVDGYHLNINLKLQDNCYSFVVSNTYHPTLDSLLTICNEMIPKRRAKKNYKLN